MSDDITQLRRKHPNIRTNSILSHGAKSKDFFGHRFLPVLSVSGNLVTCFFRFILHVIVYGQSSFGLSHCEANVASCCKTKMRMSSVKSLVTPTISSHVFEFRRFNINIRIVRVLPPSPWPVPPVLEEKANMEAGEGALGDLDFPVEHYCIMSCNIARCSSN